ncbi:uncharacterized protein LOC105685547 [Athalia rosae]|uniref:uncharacterized protein LOC105685547 n=1 Tax=Athalia rosae TaxID=37344 RepID=UPI0020333500|nr:uncharacterized protein LOC105685547 [Athalia rosae]
MVSSGFLSLLYSIRNKPLEYWSKRHSPTGRIRKILDMDLLDTVIDLQDLEKSSNVNTSIACPADAQKLLNIHLPLLVIVIKNMNVECCFKVQVLDTDMIRHHFNFSTEKFKDDPNIRTHMVSQVELKLVPGWNTVEVDLTSLTQHAFNTQYKAMQRIEICANCRLRRVYFLDRHYTNLEISPALCLAFFDYFKLKWGIHLTEKTTQTDNSFYSSYSKKKCKSSKGAVYEEAVNLVEIRRSRFLKEVQIKAEKLITDFFKRADTRLVNMFDVKSKMKLMIFSVFTLGNKSAQVTNSKYDFNKSSHSGLTSDRCKAARKKKDKTTSVPDGTKESVQAPAIRKMRKKERNKSKECCEAVRGFDNISDEIQKQILPEKKGQQQMQGESKISNSTKKSALCFV